MREMEIIDLSYESPRRPPDSLLSSEATQWGERDGLGSWMVNGGKWNRTLRDAITVMDPILSSVK